MSFQLGGGERPDGQNLVYFLFDQIECSKAGCGIWVTGGYALGFFTTVRLDNVNAQPTIGCWPGKEDSPSLVLLLHPG